MGESPAGPSHNNADSVSQTRKPTPTITGIAEDDDEPPSSGPPRDRVHQENLTHDIGTTLPRRSLTGEVRGRDFATIDRDHGVVVENSPRMAHASVDSSGDQEELGALGASSRRRLKVSKLTRTARLRALFTPKYDIGPRPTYHASLVATLRYTPLNILMLFIPVSWALHFTHQSPTLIFVFSSIGIVPLAALLGLGTEQIALRTSQNVGGLLNASLGNLIEMIISGVALKECQLEVVQSTLLGGLLSNLLLVLGCAFIVGGFRFHHQQFQPMVAQLNSSLLIVSVISLTIPAAFHQYLESRLLAGTEVEILLELSRGSAIILILIYIAYLFFQFYSHNHLFLDTLQECSISTRSGTPSHISRHSTQTSLQLPTNLSSASSEERAKLNTPSAIFLLISITGLAYVTAEHLVDSLEGLVAAHPTVSKEWITLIVIPIIGNAAEHTTAVIVASKGKFDLAMSVAVGSCIQIALFVIPILVLVAWGMGKPLTLLFDPLETVMLFLSVLVVKFSVEDGKSHWMSGTVLFAVYVLIAVSFWHFPSDAVRMIQGQALLCYK